jgi:predicted transcriptional regulator
MRRRSSSGIASGTGPLQNGSTIDYPASYMRDAVHIPPALHELEAEDMEELWQHHQASVREVMEALNTGAPKERAYTAYMTIMVRLDTKGLLERTREGKTDFFWPVYTRDRYTDLRAEAEVDSLVDQFGEVALGHFARQMAQMDPQRRRALQRLARKN